MTNLIDFLALFVFGIVFLIGVGLYTYKVYTIMINAIKKRIKRMFSRVPFATKKGKYLLLKNGKPYRNYKTIRDLKSYLATLASVSTETVKLNSTALYNRDFRVMTIGKNVYSVVQLEI
jgi:hypothetical protein